MAYYIKVNQKVAEYLALTGKRGRLADGNYLIWQGDLMPFGPLYQMKAICERIGAVMLTPQQAVQEQRSTSCATLPAATDPRFVVGPPQKEEIENESEEITEIEAENSEELPIETENGEIEEENTEVEPENETEE